MAKPEGNANKNVRKGAMKSPVVNRGVRNPKQKANSAGREKRPASGGTIK